MNFQVFTCHSSWCHPGESLSELSAGKLGSEISYCKLILPYKFCWAVKPAFQSAVSFTFASTYNLCTLIQQLLCKGAFLYWAVSAGSLWKCISFFFQDEFVGMIKNSWSEKKKKAFSQIPTWWTWPTFPLVKGHLFFVQASSLPPQSSSALPAVLPPWHLDFMLWWFSFFVCVHISPFIGDT